MFWCFFQKIEPLIIKAYKKLTQPPVPNLAGDRDVEYSWIAANIPEGPGKALDFGSGKSWLGLLASRKGFETITFDLQEISWPYLHPQLKFIKGDILEKNKFPPQSFDLILNCSSIEHVGLTNRYGVTKRNSEGDLETMKILRNLLNSGKVMLLTVPVGKDAIFEPMHRVYGKKRLTKLLAEFEIIKKEFWIKNKDNQWETVSEEKALTEETKPYYYGLGLFVLKK